MPEDSNGVAGVRSRPTPLHEDSAFRWKGEGGSPLRRAASEPLSEDSRVRRDGNQDAVNGSGDTWESVPTQRGTQKGSGKCCVTRKCYDGESPTLEREALDLRPYSARGNAEDRGKAQAERGGSPPASTCCNSSAQRLPHGLNLFARAPSRHAVAPPSRSPENQMARPNS